MADYRAPLPDEPPYMYEEPRYIALLPEDLRAHYRERHVIDGTPTVDEHGNGANQRRFVGGGLCPAGTH